ncbi:unnamed protein product, partial [Vitis vinifera]
MSTDYSACSPAPDANPETNRRAANFNPSTWGNSFIMTNSPDDEITLAHKEQQLEDLKEEVRRELKAAAGDPSKQLKQQGFNISCDIFNRYTDEKGRFKESLINDACGLLGLYEAAHLRVWEEDILDEALAFTTTHLKSMVELLEYPLAAQVTHALYRPIRKGLERLEARPYMSIYQDEASHSKALLKLAKLDFNLLQSLYKKQLSNISRWWKDLDFSSKLPFGRDRVVECYFWIATACFEPQYSYARRIQTKILALITIIDDMFDAYGTLEELELFTEAIGRWDVNSIYQSYCVHYAKEAMKRSVRAYFNEAKWLHEDYVPTIEEYLSVAQVTSEVTLFTVICFVGMGRMATKEVFEWVWNDPKIVGASSKIMRLMDDMASHKFEQERGHSASSVECYMKQHGVSEQHAYQELNKQVENAWKDVNQGCLRPPAIPMPLLTRVLNFARTGDFMYKGRDDRFTNVGDVMKDSIASLFIDPVPI